MIKRLKNEDVKIIQITLKLILKIDTLKIYKQTNKQLKMYLLGHGRLCRKGPDAQDQPAVA